MQVKRRMQNSKKTYSPSQPKSHRDQHEPGLPPASNPPKHVKSRKSNTQKCPKNESQRSLNLALSGSRSYSTQTLLLHRQLLEFRKTHNSATENPCCEEQLQKECTNSEDNFRLEARSTSALGFPIPSSNSSSEVLYFEILKQAGTLSDSAVSVERNVNISQSMLQAHQPLPSHHYYKTNQSESCVNSQPPSEVEVNEEDAEQSNGRNKKQHKVANQYTTGEADQYLENLLNRSPEYSRETLEAAIRDSYGRFIINLPPQYLKNYIHLCFFIQEAYWWYIDFWYDSFPTRLPKFSMKNFGFVLIIKCPLLRMHFNPWRFSRFMIKWRRYCQTIPLKGAILINNALDKVLMVQGWSGGRWMFPRGKVNEMEDDVSCAVRELREEVGVDVSKIINENVFIETVIDDQPLKLYVIPGILESTPFGPRKRKEISRICWIPVRHIPGASQIEKKLQSAGGSGAVDWKQSAQQAANDSNYLGTSNPSKASPTELTAEDKNLRFWSVHPFAKALLGWICLYLRGSKPRNLSQHPSHNLCNMNSEWVQFVSENATQKYSFHSPPEGYNTLLRDRYSRQNEQKSQEDMTKQGGDEKQTGKDNASNNFFLHCLVERQPLEPKPQPLPPYVDDLIWYCVPESTSHELLHRLQYPGHSHLDLKHLNHKKDTCDEFQFPYPKSSQLNFDENIHNQKSSASSNQVLNHNLNHSGYQQKITDWQQVQNTLQSSTENPASEQQWKNLKIRSIVEDFQRFGLNIGSSCPPPVSQLSNKNKVQQNKPDRKLDSRTDSSQATSVDDELNDGEQQLKILLSQEEKVIDEITCEEATEVQELSYLAQRAYDAVNSCRERLGQSKISPYDIINILGLSQTDVQIPPSGSR